MPAMGLDRPSDALAVTGRVGRWHLTLMEIPSAGGGRVASVHKNSFAGVRRALPHRVLILVLTVLQPRSRGALISHSANFSPLLARPAGRNLRLSLGRTKKMPQRRGRGISAVDGSALWPTL